MALSVPPSPEQTRELEVLIEAHHPLLMTETVEHERLGELFEHVAEQGEERSAALPVVVPRPLGPASSDECVTVTQVQRLGVEIDRHEAERIDQHNC